jgi:hypothetical protein
VGYEEVEGQWLAHTQIPAIIPLLRVQIPSLNKYLAQGGRQDIQFIICRRGSGTHTWFNSNIIHRS